jgi:transposase-like protein
MPVRRAVSVFERPRWSEEEAREVLTALARSGQSVGAFAAGHDLDPQRLYCNPSSIGV